MKKYKCGLYVGRFQPIHIGHESVIRKMLDECEQIIIVIGSAQESGTERNPFTFEQRADFITNVFYREVIKGRLFIVPIYDRYKPANDASWGDYVVEHIWNYMHRVPDVIYEGEEEERTSWYDNLDVDIVKVPRSEIPVSASMIRDGFKGEYYPSTSACLMIPRAIRYRIDEMRGIINGNEN